MSADLLWMLSAYIVNWSCGRCGRFRDIFEERRSINHISIGKRKKSVNLKIKEIQGLTEDFDTDKDDFWG